MKYLDREDAGISLSEKLIEKKIESPVIIALPRGGIPVAIPIAKTLNAPLKLMMVRKIGHPNNEEFAVGAVSLGDLFLSETATIRPEYIQEKVKAERIRIREMIKKFGHQINAGELKGKTIILVDDGIATGQCMMLAISELRKEKPTKIIVAVPVCGSTAYNLLSKKADEIISLHTPPAFSGIGAYYEDFEQLSDNEVVDLLKTKGLLKKATLD